MNELIHEIEEDIRRERVEKLWGSIGRMMVGVSVAIVLATVILVMWQNHKQTVFMRETAQFIAGNDRMAVEDYAGAITAFSALATDEHSSYWGLAMLRKAQAQEASGKHADAVATYTALAGSANPLAGLAKMQTAGDAPIEPDKASPFYDTQREWKAWQLVNAGKKDDAATIFTALRDSADAPYSLRARAAAALHYLTPQLSPAKPEAHDAAAP